MNKKQKKENTKKRMTLMLDSWNPRGGLDGDQLQPGVEDGGTPTEVVARVEK